MSFLTGLTVKFNLISPSLSYAGQIYVKALSPSSLPRLTTSNSPYPNLSTWDSSLVTSFLLSNNSLSFSLPSPSTSPSPTRASSSSSTVKDRSDQDCGFQNWEVTLDSLSVSKFIARFFYCIMHTGYKLTTSKI